MAGEAARIPAVLGRKRKNDTDGESAVYDMCCARGVA